MAGRTIGKLLINIAASTASLQRDTTKAKKHMRGVKKSAMDTKSVMKGLFAVAGGVGFSAFIKNAIDAGDELGKFAGRIGASVEGLSRLEFAAERSGVGVNQLRMGLQRMTRRISEAASGSGEAIGALQELGLSAEKLEQLAPEQAFKILADALEGLPTQADRVRVAMKLFDSEGVALLQTMKGGSAAIQEMENQSDALGNTLSGHAAQAFARINDSATNLKAAFRGAANEIVITLGPSLESLANMLGVGLPNMAEFTRRAFFSVQEGIFRFASAVQLTMVSLTDMLAKAADFVGFDNMAASLRNLSQTMLDASTTSELVANSIVETADATAKFVVEAGKAPAVLDDYRGKTQSLAQANAKNTTATNAANKAEAEALKLKSSAVAVLESLRGPMAAYRDQITTITEAQMRGLITMREYEVALAKIRRAMSGGGKSCECKDIEELKGEGGAMSEFVAEAARNMQSAMADGFFNVMEGNMDDLGANFKTMLNRMVANALAAKLGQALFGDLGANGGSGQLGGIVGSIFGKVFGGARANGGPVTSGRAYLVGEQGPELFVPRGTGQIVPNDKVSAGGGVNVTMVVNTPDAASFRRSQSQIVSDTSRALSLAAR